MRAGEPGFAPVVGSGSTDPGSGLIRVGVIVTVPDPLRTRLARWRRTFGDPLADAVPPHITLLAPSTVAVDALPAIEEHLRSVTAAQRGFTVSLRGTGSFRPVSPVVFAALAAGRAACDRLQARIRTGPLAVPLQFPYHPHVTVAHGVTEPVLDAAQHLLADLNGDFRVQTVELYQEPVTSDDPGWMASGWAVYRRFPLGRPGRVAVARPHPRPAIAGGR